MKLFKSHLEEIGTFADVREFSLLDKEGRVRYSSDPTLVKQVDFGVVGLGHLQDKIHDGLTTYYFPVETISYCSRCHPDWKIGSINSYYKLTLSRTALDSIKLTTFYSHVFTVVGGGVFLGFCYLLLMLYERKKHEEQLHLSASVFENAVEAIVITTFDGRVQKINPAFSNMTGFLEEDIIGQDIHLLDAGAVNTDTYAEMRAHIKSSGQWSGEIWNRHKSGEILPARLSVTAVRNHQQITHYVSILYDISAEKATKRALIEMDQMKSEFISSAAHELRTPLSAMLGFTEFAREPEKFGGFSDTQIKEFLDEVYDRGEALNQIIDDLLDISRIENGYAIELNLQEVPLRDFLDKLVRSYKTHHASHTLRLELPAASRDEVCLIDRHRMTQVLENLLSNATKYSAAGSEIVLTCSLRPHVWEISVVDHGIGMTPAQLVRIFDKFYRADASNTAVSGLGLGMSIAKKIVELHNGRIWIESLKDEGTTATFTLPRVSA
jgi:PAS domain S-box-containing protein